MPEGNTVVSLENATVPSDRDSAPEKQTSEESAPEPKAPVPEAAIPEAPEPEIPVPETPETEAPEKRRSEAKSTSLSSGRKSVITATAKKMTNAEKRTETKSRSSFLKIFIIQLKYNSNTTQIKSNII